MNMENLSITCETGIKFSGKYRVNVLDSFNNILYDSGIKKNLILNVGMDAVESYYLSDLTLNAAVGSGSRPNYIVGGDSTITQSGNIVTLWPSGSGLQNFSSSLMSGSIVQYSSLLQSGDVVIYTNLSRSVVLSVDMISGLSASVDTSYAIESGSNQNFTIWKTSQSKLQNEIDVKQSYHVNNGTINTTGSHGVLNNRVLFRQYIFPTRTTPMTFTEAGVRWSDTTNSDLFSRIVFDSPIFVDVDQFLLMTHYLGMEFSPELPRIFTASISGWPVAPATDTICTESLQVFNTSYVNTNGTSYKEIGLLDPIMPIGNGYAIGSFVYSDTSSLSPFGSATSLSGAIEGYIPVTKSPYTSSTYCSYKIVTCNTDKAVSTNIKTIGFGIVYLPTPSDTTNPSYQVYRMLFNQAQTKNNKESLTLVWKCSWDRSF